MFSTANYARKIVFATEEDALKAIDKITAIHTAVEDSRQSKIPGWAYRDVLFMLIHYSIASFEVLERKLTLAEKAEVFDVFNRVGQRMHLTQLPVTYNQWLHDREAHLQNDLVKSKYTVDLFRQYKKHLGLTRYALLVEAQKLVVPGRVKQLLQFAGFSLIKPVLGVYKLTRFVKLDWFLKSAILPREYQQEIKELDVV